MLNNESWLLHGDLFQKHWIVETKSWVRNLGWFAPVLQQARVDSGWMLFGETELSVMDYINIIDAKDSEHCLYMYKEGTWTYMSGPVLFVIKKNEDEVYIAGWAGDKKKLDSFQKKYDTPWDWPGINIINVVPSAVNNVLPTSQNTSKFPVFFLSNGETNAEENWQHLTRVCPRAQRINGISPRRAAFLECAKNAGKHPYFFVVTGKNKVTDLTIFDYVPDSDVPKAHIVFQAKNMSNGLEYGHMAVGCYNTSLILETPENFGLDLTEYGKIYPVPLTVSEAHFATSAHEAWRTAFRETIKLTLKDTDIAKKWLNHWLTTAQGDYAHWVLCGAGDGHAYAYQHKDNMNELLKTERWEWLEEYFTEKYENRGVV
jgi:hypothetical protein